jgi:hypothetical protein
MHRHIGASTFLYRQITIGGPLDVGWYPMVIIPSVDAPQAGCATSSICINVLKITTSWDTNHHIMLNKYHQKNKWTLAGS